MDKEVWKAVPNWEGLYEVSDLGRVRSVNRIQINILGVRRRLGGIMLAPNVKHRRRGRHDVSLRDCLRKRYVPVHRLVLEAFVGPCPDGMEGCHRNDDLWDNTLKNLRWDTHDNNIRDSLKNGGRCMGERHCKAKMTAGKVRLTRAMRASGQYAIFELSKIFKISNPAMKNILDRRAWKHV